MTLTLDSGFLRRFDSWKRVLLAGRQVARFAAYTARRFAQDHCPRQAAGLGYISLLSLVPLLAIGLGLLSAFPAFTEIRGELQALIFDNFMPAAGSAVTDQLTEFVDNASKATGPGVLAFALTAVLLLNNIDSALNAIWRVPERRAMALRLLVYWAMLTLGPLLVGSSLSLSSYAFAVVQYSGMDAYSGLLLQFTRLISIALATIGFGLIYFVVPNRQVSPLFALLGGLVAAVMFELLKAGFGFYLSNFPSYQAIYGALATVPIFLLWMYLFWVVVLIGAEVAAAAPEWQAAQARGRTAAGPGERLALALALVERLRAASLRGGAMRERELTRRLPATPAEIDDSLRGLRRARIAERSMGSRWLLARDLATITLGDLATALDLDLDPGKGWTPGAARAVAALADAGRIQLDTSVEVLLDGGAEEADSLDAVDEVALEDE